SPSGSLVYDFSGKDRHLNLESGGTNPRELVAGYGNGLPAIYFDGTNDPLVTDPDDFKVRHAFIIAGYDDVMFPAAEAGYAGLLTGIEDNDSENWILLGDPTTTKFYSTGPPQKYYLNGLHYPQINRLAAFGETAIIEVT